MNILLAVLLALVSLLLPLTNAFAQTDQEPPTAGIVFDDFSPMRQAWQPVSGQWSVANGTYGDSAAGSTDITTITQYRGLHPASPPDPDIRYEEFFMRARMRNQGTTDTHLVGVVYGYQDSQNYYEVVVSALGTVTMRTVMNGIAVDEVPSIDSGIPRNTWFEVEVRWNRGVASLKINGSSFYTAISQPEFTSGQIGLVTHSAVGRFDRVFLGVPFGDQGFLETFDPPSVTFTPQSGQWAVTNGTYRNNAVQQTSVTLAPIHTGIDVGDGDTFEFTFRARLLNPYGAFGNLVGIVFNYEGSSNYTEAVFSPTGVARVNLVENGVLRTLATANYGGRPNVPFEVAIENSPNFVSVLVNGVRLFENVVGANPNLYPQGGVGLITHWAPGRFDNVQFDHGIFHPCALTFGDPPQSRWIVSGTWNTNGGTLNSTAVGQSDIVSFFSDCSGNIVGDDAGTDAIYSARLLNEFGASGNLVGLIYNFQGTSDYFEVVFSPTGIMQLNKVFQGVRSPVRTLTHTIPRNTWFTVQVIRSGIHTNVRLNGVTVVSLLPQGELRGGSVGVITHWSKGRFDNVSLVGRASRPPSEL